MKVNRLRFLHIAKTAGTTFRAVLDRQYSPNEIFAFTGDVPADVQRFNALPKEDRSGFRLFIGHAPIISGIEAADNAETITFLRNPVSRVKSFCNHVAEGKSPYLRDEFPPDRFDLDRFLDSGNNELSNLQTKMLINRADSGSLDSLTRPSWRQRQIRPWTPCSTDFLFTAFRNISIRVFFSFALTSDGRRLFTARRTSERAVASSSRNVTSRESRN